MMGKQFAALRADLNAMQATLWKIQDLLAIIAGRLEQPTKTKDND